MLRYLLRSKFELIPESSIILNYSSNTIRKHTAPSFCKLRTFLNSNFICYFYIIHSYDSFECEMSFTVDIFSFGTERYKVIIDHFLRDTLLSCREVLSMLVNQLTSSFSCFYKVVDNPPLFSHSARESITSRPIYSKSLG